MALFPPVWNALIDVLVYISMILFFLTADNNEKRAYFLVVWAGYFAILYLFLPVHGFYLFEAVFTLWLLLVKIPLLFSRELTLALVLLTLILPLDNPLFYFLAFIFYTIILGDFVIGAFMSLNKKLKIST